MRAHPGTAARRPRRLLALACALVAAGAVAPAQDAPEPNPAQDGEYMLWSRGREILHSGEPETLFGHEEAGNDFRARTPALERSDRAAARVDVEELRRRRLAMYAEGARFTVPTPRPAGAEVAPPRGRNERGSRATGAEDPGAAAAAGGSGTPWTIAVLVLVICLGWAYSLRPAPDPPSRQRPFTL